MLAEVAELAAVIYWAIGGNDENEPPHDEGIMTAEEHREFVDFLKQLMKGETTARRSKSGKCDVRPHLAQTAWQLNRSTETRLAQYTAPPRSS
jgi:hypothetical protein